MTAVLQATDALRNERLTHGNDDINFSSSSDWKTKYYEVADMLAETRAELDDFQTSSKELEEELERELERTEKAQQDLKVKALRAEQEKDEWKSKFMSFQTTHNTTTTSLQKELDTLRKEHQQTKIQLRELEMGNDDLERNERAISSSLADIEQKYSRVLEEKILLEHELLDKAHLEEECQRFKDDLRDANEEIAILRDQLSAARDRAPVEIPPETPSASSQCASEDDVSVPSTPALHNSQLHDIFHPETPAKELPPIITTTPRTTEALVSSGQASLLHRAGLHSRTQSISMLMRSSTTPAPTSSRTPSSRPTTATRNVSSATTTNIAGVVPGTTAKSRGVQMVSEMRARVKVLEQKIHTRVPRIRMGSVTNRSITNPISPPLPPPQAGPSSTTSSIASNSASSLSARSSSPEKTTTLKPRRESGDHFDENTRTPVGDTSGWVLIMEDSPSPLKNKDKERRRISGGIKAPSAYRPLSMSSTSSASTSEGRSPSAMSQSSVPVRRPQSRLSVSTEGRSSIGTNATTSTASSIPTPSSRPSTPTFLPIPASGMYHAALGAKIPSGPSSSGTNTQPKRSSFGSSRPIPPPLSLASSQTTIRPKLGSPAFGYSRIGRSPYNHGNRKGSASGIVDEEHPSTAGSGRGVRGRATSSSTLFGRGY